MGQRNLEKGARQSGVVPSVGDHSATQISRTPRGLELIKSCAKFYSNGVAAKPTVQLSHPTGPALSQSATSSSRVATVSISTVAASCFFFVLPSLALGTIVWLGATAPAVKGPEDAAGYANSSSSSSQIASQALRSPGSLQEATGAQAGSTARSDIIIRKVKTQPIAPGAWDDARPSEISATE